MSVGYLHHLATMDHLGHQFPNIRKKWLDQETIGLQVMHEPSSRFHDKRKILSGFRTLPFHLECNIWQV